MLTSVILNKEITRKIGEKKQIKKITIINETEKAYQFNISSRYIGYNRMRDYEHKMYIAKSQCKIIEINKIQYLILGDKYMNIVQEFGNSIEQYKLMDEIYNIKNKN